MASGAKAAAASDTAAAGSKKVGIGDGDPEMDDAVWDVVTAADNEDAWEEHKDASGNTFYYHVVSGKSVWTKEEVVKAAVALAVSAKVYLH